MTELNAARKEDAMTADEIAALRAENERLRKQIAASDDDDQLELNHWVDVAEKMQRENQRLRLELMAIYLADRNFIDSSNVIDGTITTGFHVGNEVQVLGEMGKIAGRAIGEVK